MSISKQPAVGTSLSVICKTPSESPLVGITLEVVGLRSDVSTEKDTVPTNRTPVTVRGQNDYVISDKEIDDTRNSPSEIGLGLAADECILNINATGPDFQPNRPGAKPGEPDSRQVHLFKGKKDFAPSTAVVLHLINKCLAKFTIDPAILKKRVRNLTVDEAYLELVHRHKAGTIRLIPEPVFDANCVPQTPKRALPQKKTVLGTDGKAQKDENDKNILENALGPDGKPKFAVTRLIAMDPRVGNVKLLYNASVTRGGKAGAADIVNVNPINAAGLVRLVLVLTRKFGITEFHHIGIGRSVIIDNGDCHDWGRAIDFVGVLMPDPAAKPTPFLMKLQQDWSGESVPKIAEIGQRPTKKGRDAAWPAGGANLEFRFLSLNLVFDPADPPDEQQRVVNRALADGRVSQTLKDNFNKVLKNTKHTPDELDAVRAPLLAEHNLYIEKAREFFQFFFDWASDNYSQRSETPDPTTPAVPATATSPEIPAVPPPDALETPDQPPPPPPLTASPPTPMGLGGRIMHPDHHDSSSQKSGREAHQGHYHIQIGPTRGKMPDEPSLT